MWTLGLVGTGYIACHGEELIVRIGTGCRSGLAGEVLKVLSLILRIHVKKLSAVAHRFNPSFRTAEEMGRREASRTHWPASLAYMVSVRLVSDLISRQTNKQINKVSSAEE